jgi:hypothetical protein
MEVPCSARFGQPFDLQSAWVLFQYPDCMIPAIRVNDTGLCIFAATLAVGGGLDLGTMMAGPSPPGNHLPEKRAAQACSLRCDELIDKGAIITGE